jgi:hypothetical protein
LRSGCRYRGRHRDGLQKATSLDFHDDHTIMSKGGGLEKSNWGSRRTQCHHGVREAEARI